MDWKVTALGLFICLVVGPMIFKPTMIGTDTTAGKEAGLEGAYASRMYSKCMFHTKPGHNQSFGKTEESRGTGCKCVGEKMEQRLKDYQIFQAGVIFDQTFETQRRVGQKLVMQSGVSERGMGKKRYRIARKTASTMKGIFNSCRAQAHRRAKAQG